MPDEEAEPQSPPTDEEVIRIIDSAFLDYEGDVTVFYSAVGALMLGRKVGWEGLRVTMASRTFASYERQLGIKWRKVLPRRGPDSGRLYGIRRAEKFKNLKLWQLITSGQIPVAEAKMARKGEAHAT